MTSDREVLAKRWIKRAKRLAADIPKGMEAHLNYGSISLYEEGRLDNHLKSEDSGFGISDDTEICMECVDSRFIPYSEGS